MSAKRGSPTTTTSTSSTTYETTNIQTSLQDAPGALAVAGNQFGDLTITDGGAIEALAAVTLEAVSGQQKAQADALGFATGAGNNALKFAFEAGRPDAANVKQYLTAASIVAGGAVALLILRSWK